MVNDFQDFAVGDTNMSLPQHDAINQLSLENLRFLGQSMETNAHLFLSQHHSIVLNRA